MLFKGDENPFLQGKPAKDHISVNLSLGSNPFEHMTDAEREETVKKFAESNNKQFVDSLTRLKEICRSYNFFYLLTHFGYYDQAMLDGMKRDKSYEPIEQSAAELLQALILQIPEEQLRLRLSEPPPPEVLLETNQLLSQIIITFSLRRLSASPDNSKDANYLSEVIRSHTAAIRNEGYASQIRRTMLALASPLDVAFETKRGASLSKLGTMLWNIVGLLTERLSNDFQQRQQTLRLNNAGAMLNRFLELRCPDQEQAEHFAVQVKQSRMSLRKLRAYLFNYWDQGNFKLFILSVQDCINAYPGDIDLTAMQWVLSQWSHPLGALAAQEAERFFLNNPIWSKPIVHFGPNHFLLAFPSMIHSFGRQMLEVLIQNDNDMWEKYQNKVRPQFLETSVAKLFRESAPSVPVYTGLIWKNAETKQQFETDILIILDTHALIIECKAGRITAPARRGSLDRLEREVGKLIEEPTLQGQRFAELLTNTKGILHARDSNGKNYQIDVSRLLRITRLNVLLDYIGPVGLLARILREAGMVSKNLLPAATINLYELENIIELLDHPALLFHYLGRRAEIELSNDLLTDEISLLALYLATGFDLGDFEGGENLSLTSKLSSELDPYFMGKELDLPVTKPKRQFTKWWNDLLAKLEHEGRVGRMESSYALLSVNHEKQKKFERGKAKMLKEVSREWENPKHKNVCGFTVGSPDKPLTIMSVGVKNVTREKMRDIVQGAYELMNHDKPTYATLAIVHSLNTNDYPYSALYLLRPRRAS